MIPYGRQDITEEDILSVTEVLRSDFLTQGPAVERFETSVADAVSAPFAVAVNSATSALHIACLALDVGPGDIVWTSPVTFVASANCARYCGADVDFVDIDESTYNLSVSALRTKLEVAQAENRLPKVVIPVHLAGQSCDMKAIAGLAKEFGFRVIEDASHGIGGSYKDSPVGNCQYSDITVFSFHPVKIVTTGEGGVATTKDAALAERMQRLRSHGITRDTALMTKASDGPWYYQQLELGFNYRMTDIQAALGISQMNRLRSFVDRRRQLAMQYSEKLSELPLILPHQISESDSSWHLYIVRVKPEGKIARDQLFDALRERGIGVNLHYIPVHLQPYYQALGFQSGDYPVAESYYQDALSIPLFHGMSDAEQDIVVASLRELLI
ncbi:UDP-4-amino-4,6-dideoxy-N-acetyl-beta-L-altrosamine transaminase [uncultured Thalassolituus sp.]|uniref:UDP-4-amino-4, 6-dideoxy-N-acetyl-beta-L-altrosamine transaminase n=1 Tax=uncultured Thalassolituus sp. TaxID=285273 RepID=UPI00260A1A4C|nr:UDP-4-amino-4,6-dideoxy-N-acetyl-beta-L-altrosamine transaminase [uncultured Thalassolituus sp.]